jgi:hypothetical protein
VAQAQLSINPLAAARCSLATFRENDAFGKALALANCRYFGLRLTDAVEKGS